MLDYMTQFCKLFTERFKLFHKNDKVIYLMINFYTKWINAPLHELILYQMNNVDEMIKFFTKCSLHGEFLY